ncbi:MAG: dTDP-4-amino-4,6-dideoxygalactose transaminase [Anaerolineales bacterium]
MMANQQILFCRPPVVGTELKYLSEVMENRYWAGDGSFTKKCHALLEDILDVPKVLLTTSCTDALEMSAILLNLEPGDEVIIPSYTFVTTANAFVLHGAKPIFADIRPDTLNIDESQLEQLITSRTKAIVPVHYAGVGCEMDVICDLANQHNIAIIEDNAHGLFGKYKGRYLGTFGQLATQSFHETKNFSCGEGGALLINDENCIDRAEIIREKGTNRSRFFRGQVDKYTWVDVGSSFLPADILAAFLFAQLEAREEIQVKRAKIWRRYFEDLESWAADNNVRIPIIPDDCEQSYHMFYLLMPTLEQRQALIAHLKRRNIESVFHYLPLHLSKMGRSFGGKQGDCPVTEDVSDRLVRLPLHHSLTEADLDRVVSAVTEFELCSSV